jgi:PAS domain S-box-containing protein
LAIAAALAALLLRELLIPLLGYRDPYHTVWLAVVFSAWYCGLGPSIVTTLLGTLGVWYWFLPPTASFAIRDRTDVYGVLGFLIFSGVIIALGEPNRRGFAIRSRLAAIIESFSDAIISKNLEGVITSWNKSAETVFGYTAEEAVGRHITMIIPPEYRDEEARILERLRRGERIEHLETVRVRKDGTKLDVSLAISPVRDVTGRIVGASKVARDITQQKQAEEAIRQSELSVRLLQLQDEERRRVARELHDGVGQLLAAMSMNASRLGREKSNLSPDGARCAEENSRLIEQVSAEIRTVSYLFHPPLLDEMGLDSALKWYVDGFAERSGIAVRLEVPADWERLPPEYELCLFRVVQECLTNIHRHSGGKTAAIRLSRANESISLEVEDDGIGIPAEKLASNQNSGVGIRGMQERVRHFKGSMDIQSNGDGTKISVSLPAAGTGGSERPSALKQTGATA